jgi:hypothetical protein
MRGSGCGSAPGAPAAKRPLESAAPKRGRWPLPRTDPVRHPGYGSEAQREGTNVLRDELPTARPGARLARRQGITARTTTATGSTRDAYAGRADKFRWRSCWTDDLSGASVHRPVSAASADSIWPCWDDNASLPGLRVPTGRGSCWSPGVTAVAGAPCDYAASGNAV